MPVIEAGQDGEVVYAEDAAEMMVAKMTAAPDDCDLYYVLMNVASLQLPRTPSRAGGDKTALIENTIAALIEIHTPACQRFHTTA